MGADSIGLALLTRDELRTIEKQHPELLLCDEQGGSAQALTISGSPALLSAVRVLVEHIAREQQQSAAVLSALASSPELAVITTERLEQIHRQAEAQNAFVDSVELLASAMIGAWRGSSAKNSSAMASRWKSAGRIFAVPSGRADLYPESASDSPVPDPPDFSKLSPAIDRWPVGTDFVRVFSRSYAATAFHAGTGAPVARGRFHFFADGGGHVVPVMYGAAQEFAALAETVFHSVPISGTSRVVFESRLEPLSIGTLRPNRDLCLVRLHGFGLHRLSFRAQNLTDTDAGDYPRTIEWARTLHARCQTLTVWRGCRGSSTRRSRSYCLAIACRLPILRCLRRQCRC